MNDAAPSCTEFLGRNFRLNGAEVTLRSLAMPTLDMELSDADRVDHARVDIVLSDGTAYFEMMPRKTAALLQGTTVEYDGEPLNIENATIAD